MAMITIRRKVLLFPIKPLFSLQGLYHKSVDVGEAKPRHLSEDDFSIFQPGEVDVSKWKKIDSRSLGITRMMLPSSPYTVLQILQSGGFEAYLVGGCVRDLLLNRTPKDFDVITTADLDQISKQFHRCEVVGHRFPVCRVYLKGSVVEVSSFATLAKDAEGKEKFLTSQMPIGGDKLDLIRWKNSMHRDFTVNSLFFDPFIHKIYDYNDGMEDLLELKLRTLVPAQLSFTEDSARILRGVRIAARLGLSLSMEIKSAILKNASSISRLGQSRITMELNYMLSYGAAASSFSLLHKYHLLEILLPFQAAYISQQSTRSGQSSMMLMKLLINLDKLVTCDHPSGSRLWIGLLGFHLALVNNPQHPFVVMAFASVLYHQNWDHGIKFARKYGGALVSFQPETLGPCKFLSDDVVAEKVNQLAMQVVDSIDILVDRDSLHKTMTKFTSSPWSNLVFIPKYMGHSTRQLFHVLAHNVETYKKGRTSFEINYDLLRKGDSLETRFALGKIILDTMGCGVDSDPVPDNDNHHLPSSPKINRLVKEKEERKLPLPLSNLKLQRGNSPTNQKMIATLSSIMQQNEYRVPQDEHQEGVSKKHTHVDAISSDPKGEVCTMDTQEIGTSESQIQEIVRMLEAETDDETFPSKLEIQNREERLVGIKQVKIDHPRGTRLPEIAVENDETCIGTVVCSVQSTCSRAIEEAKDSLPDMRKLNQFLVSFVDKQALRKKAKELEEFSLVSSVGSSESDGKQSESKPQICMQHPEEPKITLRPKKTSTTSSMNGEGKKQRVCSYCKEIGHNRTRCPKRKSEEASFQVDTEST